MERQWKRGRPLIRHLIQLSLLKSADFGKFLITSKVLDARRRGATIEAYRTIRRKPAPAKAGGGAIEGNTADDALMVDQGRLGRLVSL